jgi:pilus assembly protein CpaF
VRKFNRWFTSDELVASGSLPSSVRDTVVGLIGARKNGIIAGGTGSGKTTLMKALLDHVPMQERLIVIEQPAELKIAHPNAVRWEAVATIPGQVAVTPSQLVAAALRHRPDRIIMGEIRDECGYDLLQAMNTGHGGTLSTLHADSAVDALDRLADMALSARTNLNQQFIRSQTGKAVDYVLYCERDSKGRRRVRELITVKGYSHAEQSFETEEIYRASSTAAA